MDSLKPYLDAIGPVGALFALGNVAQYIQARKFRADERQDSADRWKAVSDLTLAVVKLTERLGGGGK